MTNRLSNDIFRIATAADIDRCWQILQQGKAQMMREGKHQWTDAYPAKTNVEQDVALRHAYVLERNGIVIAYAAVIIDGEPAYAQLAGKWISTDDHYVVVHRLAVADEAKRQGVAAQFFIHTEQFAISNGIHSIKVDTNNDNFYMLHLMKNLGFSYRGIISYPQGERLAYEKII